VTNIKADLTNAHTECLESNQKLLQQEILIEEKNTAIESLTHQLALITKRNNKTSGNNKVTGSPVSIASSDYGNDDDNYNSSNEAKRLNRTNNINYKRQIKPSFGDQYESGDDEENASSGSSSSSDYNYDIESDDNDDDDDDGTNTIAETVGDETDIKQHERQTKSNTKSARKDKKHLVETSAHGIAATIHHQPLHSKLHQHHHMYHSESSSKESEKDMLITVRSIYYTVATNYSLISNDTRNISH
jgi:hypothetical protein